MLSFLPLAFRVPYLWVLTVVLAGVGLAVLAYGYVLADRFDPNAGDPEPRKARGRRYSVWGDQLTQLLATEAATAQSAAQQDEKQKEFFRLFMELFGPGDKEQADTTIKPAKGFQ